MNPTLKKIVIRILVLIVPIALLIGWHLLTFNPHARCSGGEHRHVDGFLGIALLSLFWLYGWLAFVALEILYYFFKKYFGPKA